MDSEVVAAQRTVRPKTNYVDTLRRDTGAENTDGGQEGLEESCGVPPAGALVSQSVDFIIIS